MDVKHRLGGKKHAQDRPEANVSGEKASPSASFLRPDLSVAASGHDGEGSIISTGVVLQAHSRDPSPQPEPTPANEGHEDGEVDVGGKEVGGRHSRLDPNVEGVAGGGFGQEVVKQVTSPLSITPIPPKQEPDSTWTFSPLPLCLIIRLDNADISVLPDHTSKGALPDENIEPDSTANEKKSDWKSTAFATAKLLLRGVRDTADAFGPLKSVAGGLCFILENCEVWSSPCMYYHSSYTYPANERE